ncbi:MBL fold metallo-hydrolase RNA specificity domain-containing protein [Halomonas sp.]|uniref:MBL fold metallo-hydrolase RNA specificity domain-containing protein n=1 Tax=Halomonas sp. TaxID=1486246 RepID=UPI003F8DDC59
MALDTLGTPLSTLVHRAGASGMCAGVTTISGYFAHADQADLLEFIKQMLRWPHEVRLVHGDTPAKQTLKTAIEAMADQHGKPIRVTLPVNQP